MKRVVPVWIVWLAAMCLARADTPTLPAINTNNIINVTNAPYNANGNGTFTNTAAIQSAINAAAAGGLTNGLSGGTVELPGPGTYLTGPLTMASKVNLQIDTNVTLLFLPESSYPNATGVPAYPLAGTNLTDLEISGSGTIDGNGAGWWSADPPNRPYMIYYSKCQRVLIQDVKLQNPPKMHIVFKNSAANVTIQRITINTVSTSPNTDGIDLIGTNCLVQNCTNLFSCGDDNIALGSSSSTATTSDVVITNCSFGSGHGVSIGSNTQGGVSNLTVINCTFNGTDYGIRMKSDNTSIGGSGQGGIAQNLSYVNIGMTNIVYGPIVIYSYYNEVGNPTNISPATAAAQPTPVPTNTVVWRNIVISNVTATVAASKGIAGIIWARTEMPLTNITLSHVTITAPRTFDIYNAFGVNIVDSQITSSSGSTFTLYNAQVTVTNSAFPGTGPVTLDGLTTTNINTLLLYNARASLGNTNVLGTSPVLTSGGTILTVSNNLNLTAPTVLNLLLGTNADQIAVTGSLALAGTLNIADGGGFGAGSYTLFTYGTNLNWGSPTFGTTPAGFTYSFDTNTAKQVELVVVPLAPDVPTNLIAAATNAAVQLTWSPSATATSYNLKRSTTSGGAHPLLAGGVVSTNYTDTSVTNGVTYYYVVSAVNAGGESADSGEVSAQPSPSLAPVSLVFQAGGSQLQVSWPLDHVGWRLQMQTNPITVGVSANWTTVSGSDTTNQVFIPINPAMGCEFLQLVYP